MSTAATPLRVMVVDDTVVYRKIVGDVLAMVPGVEVVGNAANGRIALQKIEQLQPDLLTLDVEMPEMDGLELLRQLQTSGRKTGAIMLSAFTAAGGRATVAALQAGAFDFVLKPTGGTIDQNRELLRRDLASKIAAYARQQSVRQLLSRSGVPEGPPRKPLVAPTGTVAAPAAVPAAGPPQVVALGISTGGPRALCQMLPELPADFPVPVLIVQHMPPVFTKSLADELNTRCKLRVVEATDGQVVGPGMMFIAPGGKHLKVRRQGETVLTQITDDPAENSCRPSVDYLFRSVAEVYGGRSVGVIMTGMGNDGSAGCRQMKRCGASIMAQDAASCVVFGMPRECIEQGVADVVAPLNRIAPELVRLVSRGRSACK